MYYFSDYDQYYSVVQMNPTGSCHEQTQARVIGSLTDGTWNICRYERHVVANCFGTSTFIFLPDVNVDFSCISLYAVRSEILGISHVILRLMRPHQIQSCNPPSTQSTRVSRTC